MYIFMKNNFSKIKITRDKDGTVVCIWFNRQLGDWICCIQSLQNVVLHGFWNIALCHQE